MPNPQGNLSGLTQAQGLYDPSREHDACGVAFVATLRGKPGRDIVDAALTVLENLDHRGAVGAEPTTGDGAGLLTQMPHKLMERVFTPLLPAGETMPLPGHYAVGLAFLPQGAHAAAAAMDGVDQIVAEEGLKVLAWRDLPIKPKPIGPTARANMPVMRQVLITDPAGELNGIALDQRAFRVKKRALNQWQTYFCSLSARTLVYKGMLTTAQLEPFFPDLSDQDFETEIALVHSRFSTNTFPSWPLAQPFSHLAHNGEINTVMGNRNWLSARAGQMQSDLIGDIAPLRPICAPGESDSASFNSVLELLHLAGRSLPHAMLMMIPQAWENNSEMDQRIREFYEFHDSVQEAWDGPAAIAFTDGTLVGATLDRNGLRPGRYWVTKDGLVVMASEAGVLDIPQDQVVRKGRLEPGRMFLVDLERGRIIENHEIKSELAARQPYGEWMREHAVYLDQLPPREHVDYSSESVVRRQLMFGYTEEELRLILSPMAITGAEPIGSMGNDTPLAVLSDRPRLLFDYFNQLFAQVTNPPLDAIREEMVTSLATAIGPMPNLLAEDPAHARKLVMPFPVVNNEELAKITRIARYKERSGGFTAITVRGLYRVDGGGAALKARLEEIFAEVDQAVAAGTSFIVLSDRESTADLAPIPSLLLVGAVHHHLLRNRTRTQIGLVVEAGDVREVHHIALLIGYGAAAVNPYLAMESVEKLARQGDLGDISEADAVAHLIKALGKGVLKVMSKMGISTVSSYRGAQVFEAVGLAQDLVDEYFTGTTSRLGGIGLEQIAQGVEMRHHKAYPRMVYGSGDEILESGGLYKWRRDGEIHLLTPDAIFELQAATRRGDFELYRRYARRIDDQAGRLATLRGLFKLKEGVRPAVPLDEVEPVSEIVKRFSTGAMSYGSISMEAHSTLAIAMNQLGAKSNTGEGGEDPERLHDPARRSAIKQVASGRFGVTAEYLTNADDLQIKMAQGAKPGEGGQLPGAKVYPWIGRTRHSTPGVQLISPPPHHDIYSIEDLKQLIHDLKNANPGARIHVKLVAEVGVGTVAAGVSKAHADVVLISGHDGGTGASPLTSIKHAGGPWELGLAETQQTLILNNLRDRITVQVDGQLKTGRDVIIAALLGAEEFGFATAPLVTMGCVMMRVCQKDTCPVGVATQNPELRARFSGKPEYVVNYFQFVAQEVREYLAALGFRTLEEAVGHVEMIEAQAAIDHWKAAGLDLTPILHQPENAAGSPLHRVRAQDHGLEAALDNKLIAQAAPALEHGEPVFIEARVRNVNRTVGTMLGHEVTKRYGGEGLPPGTIDITLTGTGGQSFGAFVPRGIVLRLVGDSNDYLGKGLSGGRIVVHPAPNAGFRAERSIIAGNVIGYGATSGQIFLRGRVGERFAVRNSGASLVVEGVGDHACEYMTGGVAVILGATGRNFGAGMSGGRAYVLDLDRGLVCPQAMKTGELLLQPVEDDAELKALVEEHASETGSTVASELLANWPEAVTRFTQVTPREYARMNAALAKAKAAGLDYHDPEVWASIMKEAAHG
ncbi:MAG: glutamate synthase large subunit [Bifidobacteriaceae bacterium]|jgi:glutamate synthase (NADPH/NADH) large chain|nr:glutamate synthase large subunit [Bifidobacteriaceae bacterium]